MSNGVFHTGASKSRGGSPQPSGGGTDWGGLLGIVASGLAALAGGLGRRYYGGTGSSASGGVDYLKQAINHPVQYKPPKDEKFESESWESIITQGNQSIHVNREQARLEQFKLDARKATEAVSKMAQQRREQALTLNISQQVEQRPATRSNERAAFNQRVYDNAPPQVGGIAGARERRTFQAGAQIQQQDDNGALQRQRARQQRRQALDRLVGDTLIPEGGIGEFGDFIRAHQGQQFKTKITAEDQRYLVDNHIKPRLEAMSFLPYVGTAIALFSPYSAPLDRGLALADFRKFYRLLRVLQRLKQQNKYRNALIESGKFGNKARKLTTGIKHIKERIVGKRSTIWTAGIVGDAETNYLKHYNKHVIIQ